MHGWQFVLLATAFVLHTDDYVTAGVLPALANALGVAEGQAGQLVTVFSLTVALAAPVAAVVLAHASRRRLFGFALLVFIFANSAATVAPSFAALLLLRVVAAMAAASTTPALFAFAVRHAPVGRTGRYIAIVSLGVTGSTAAGMGTWIGEVFGWRATFAAMALAGVRALLTVLATLPRQEGSDETPVLREQLHTLRQRPILLGLFTNCLLVTGS